MVQHAEGVATNDDQHLEQPSWSPYIVHIRATVSGLDSPIIPFAILKENPLLAFESRLASVEQQAKTQTELLTAIIDAWNMPFAALSQEKHFFVYAWSSIPGVSSRVVRAAGLYVGVATPGVSPGYARYVTTRAVQRQGKWVGWCIEIQHEMGEKRAYEVELGVENMIQFLPE